MERWEELDLSKRIKRKTSFWENFKTYVIIKIKIINLTGQMERFVNSLDLSYFRIEILQILRVA